MSLTTWFRDYVYFPLGGSRVKVSRNIFNIAVVWALTGIWHGASWNFMLWGLYFGLLLMLEKFVLNKVIDKTPKVLRHIYVWIFAMIGWCIFSFESVGDIGKFVAGMFDFTCFVDDRALFMLNQYKVVLIMAFVFSMPVIPLLKKKVEDCENSAVKTVAGIVGSLGYMAMLILSVALIIGGSYNPFIYFRF